MMIRSMLAAANSSRTPVSPLIIRIPSPFVLTRYRLDKTSGRRLSRLTLPQQIDLMTDLDHGQFAAQNHIPRKHGMVDIAAQPLRPLGEFVHQFPDIVWAS